MELLTPDELALTRYTLSDYLQWRVEAIQNPFAYAPAPPVVSYGGSRIERAEDSYTSLATYAYRGSSVVAACMRVRRNLFRQARFCWRAVTDTGPGRVFRTPELGLLDRPWPNGTTGELLTRMVTDVDLCGNSFIVNEGDRLRWLRPDWVSIVLTGNPLVDDQVDVRGYIYTPGGADVDNGVAFQPHEVCHWSPEQDPLAFYRGMSWVSMALEDIQGDRAATTHKLSFFRHGATLGPIIRVPAGVSKDQFKEFIAESEAAHVGPDNAYRPFYIGGGADVSLSMADFRQLDLKAVQGGYETRIAAVAGVHPTLVGLSEGLAGSSLNAGNFAAARRATAEMTLFTLWQDACGALQAFFDPPDDAELWIRERDIPFLREERKDQAEITRTKIMAFEAGIRAGLKADPLVDAIESDDFALLKGAHSGLYSVQLQPPGTLRGKQQPPAGGPPDFGALREPIQAGVATTRRAITAGPSSEDETVDALVDALGEIERAYNPDQPRVPKGFEGGGRFRSLADRVFDALDKWVKGEGDDDPLDEFDREQLRKTAKVLADRARAAGDDERAARLTPRRGASSDEIKLALYKDIRARVRTDKEAAPEPARETTTGKRAGGRYAGRVRAAATGLKARDAATHRRTKDEEGFLATTGLMGRGRFDGTDLSKSEVLRSIRHYGRDGYKRINGTLRRSEGANTPAAARGLDAVMAQSELTRDVVVHRGVHDIAKTFPGVGRGGSLVGLKWIDHGFVSTTTSGGTEPGYFTAKTGLSMRILVPKGTSAISSHELDTNELLLNRGLTFRVVTDHGSVDGVRAIDVEVVG